VVAAHPCGTRHAPNEDAQQVGEANDHREEVEREAESIARWSWLSSGVLPIQMGEPCFLRPWPELFLGDGFALSVIQQPAGEPFDPLVEVAANGRTSRRRSTGFSFFFRGPASVAE
jgi:hypothetical protein